MTYLALKSLHILSAIVLFGVRLGSAYYKWMADRSGNVAHIAISSRHVVIADWLFTTPSVLIQPISGFWLAHLLGIPFDSQWLVASFFLYAVAGVCWLPVVYLQIRMQCTAEACAKQGSALPALYWRMARAWFWLGVPAFVAMTMVVVLMVYKRIPGGAW